MKRVIYLRLLNRPLYNVYGSNFKKKVLISYIVAPFRVKSHSHSNFFEVTAAARIFHDLGFVVDVMHYEGSVPELHGYEVIYGFGDVFQRYFERSDGGAKTIYYGAGMHVCHQNNATLKRVKDVYKKKNVWLCGSARYVEKSWTHQTALVDGIIALGNEQCADTYRKHYDGEVFSCPAPFFKMFDYRKIVSRRGPDANRGYLWFGSAGLVHKGLDLCLEYFQENHDLELHVCGNIFQEPDFVDVYHEALFSCPNIHVHGFVDIQSETFKDILASCSFVVFPSCSEGGSPSVLTAIGNGALIPIVSTESSVTVAHCIMISSLTLVGLADAIELTRRIPEENLKVMQCANADFVLAENNLKFYESTLKCHIVSVLGMSASDINVLS